MTQALAEALRRSVRLKLLAMVMVPLLIGVPVLFGLVWTWGNEAYDRMLRAKAGTDLVTAHQYFERVKQQVGQDLLAFAGSSRLAEFLQEHPGRGAHPALESLAIPLSLDFLQYLDLHGQAVAGSSEGSVGASRKAWPAVATALTGVPRTTVEVFSPTELAGIDAALAFRARQPLATRDFGTEARVD